MAQHSINDEQIEQFEEALHGDLIRPDDVRKNGALSSPSERRSRSEDAAYDDARAVWNGMIDKYPPVIARCTGVADVISAVKFARETDVPVAVRGGGHNVAGTAVCDDGLVIDCSEMTGVRVDPDGRTARVQAVLVSIPVGSLGILLVTPLPGESRLAVTTVGLVLVEALVLYVGYGVLTRVASLSVRELLASD